jgi:hypothetical protein
VYRRVSLLIATLSDAGGASYVIASDINDVSKGWTITWLRKSSLVRGVSKKFGEWYQKTNKTEDAN